MKTFDILEVIAVVPILALVGIVIVTIGITSLLYQTSNATVVSGGKVQETRSNEDLNPVLGSMFLNGTDTLTSFNSINETYTKISYTGNRTIIPLNTSTALIINATERKSLDESST